MRSLDDIVRMNEERAKEMLSSMLADPKTQRETLTIRLDKLIDEVDRYDKEMAQSLREQFKR